MPPVCDLCHEVLDGNGLCQSADHTVICNVCLERLERDMHLEQLKRQVEEDIQPDVLVRVPHAE